MRQSLSLWGQGPTKNKVNQCLKMDIVWNHQSEYVRMHIVFWEVIEGSQMWQAVNLGLGFGEANKKKQKLEVMFRVLGFAQRCIDFKESFIVVLNVGVYLSSSVYSHGQLYVVISRVTSSANIKIFSDQGPNGYMRDVVYKEVLEMQFVTVIL